jgi:hypothetical protein
MLISWKTPKKMRPTAEHNAMYQSDTNIAGTYVPNMSEEDAEKWRGKLIGGDDPRVEVRRRTENWTQIVLVVRPREQIRLSMNGPIVGEAVILRELAKVLEEARLMLDMLDAAR